MRRPSLTLAAAAAIALAAPAGAQAAESFYGITQGNVLVAFQSDNVRQLDLQRPVRGLPAGEQLIGLDVRPATGQLYALGQSSRLYVINQRTGGARAVGAGPFSPALQGTQFGFDFNPTVDRIRVTSDADQNLRINPDTGEATNDTALAYAAGDPGSGTNPAVASSAYTDSAPGATQTTLYDIDNARGALVTQNPANAGTLQTVGALGGTGPVFSFDIGDANAAFAVRQAGEAEARLLSVDLRTGAVRDASARPAIDTAQPLRAIAAAGGIPDDGDAPDVSVALSSTQLDTTLFAEGVVPTVACDEACTATVTVRRGGRTVGTGTGEVRREAGRVRVPARLDAETRAAVRRSNTLLTVRIAVTDGSGNDTVATRRVRSQTLAERRG